MAINKLNFVSVERTVCRVLIIDDSVDDRAEVRRLLLRGSERRYQFYEAETAAAGIELCRGAESETPDCILLDYHLPDADVSEVLAALRLPNGSAICPIVVFTGQVSLVGRNEVLRAGAHDFIDKHVMTSDLVTRAIESATERWRISRELQLSEAKFKGLKELLPLIVWTATINGDVDYVNKYWSDFTGYPVAQAIGAGWSKCVHSDDVESLSVAWAASRAAGTEFVSEHRIRHVNLGYRWVLCRAIPLKNEYDIVYMWLGTLTDINDQKIAGLAFQDGKEEAEHANSTKSHFLAHMSHEIRSPLGVMTGFAELLREPNLSEAQRSLYLETIVRTGIALNRLVDDILDLSKVEAGKIQIEQMETAILPLIAEVAAMFGPQAAKKGIAIRCEIDTHAPKTIFSDPTRLRQILINIVSNALKFSSHGEVIIEVSKEHIPGSVEHLVIAITDDGPGLKAVQQARLFQSFVQANASTNREHGGSGLGLVLSRRLAVLLGGDLTLKSYEPNKGCTFLVKVATIMLNEGKVPSSESFVNLTKEVVGISGNNSLLGIKMLVADDSPDNRLLTQRMLVRQGAVVDFAQDGEEAVRKALDGEYDLVLMDIEMPLLDGYGATRQLRVQGYNKPIVALTANAMREDMARSLDAGCNAHLTKPINLNALISKVRLLVESTTRLPSS